MSFAWLLAGLVAFFLLARIGVEWKPGAEPTWEWIPFLGQVTW